MVFYKSLVEKSISKREELKLTTSGLAIRAGLEDGTIEAFEEGSTKIPVEAFLKIMDALNFEITVNTE